MLMSFKDRKFVIVSGGGRIARLYIEALKKEGLSIKNLSYAGIAITRINAKFLANFFMKKQHYPIPTTLKEVENLLKKHNIVFCGALRYEPDNTSDGTAAEIAVHLDGRFINVTNVKGLYTKDPRKHKDAKFISRISWDDFYEIAHRMEYAPGQHFVLDQHAAAIIKKRRIVTCIVDNDVANLKSLLQGKRFVGTVIG
jgi:uridylate kinase